MSQAPKLLCDENIHVEVAPALRRLGFDVIHITEVRRKGKSDSEQLRYAVSSNRAVVTHDIADFTKLHHEFLANGWEHFGIIVSRARDLRAMILKLRALLEDNSVVVQNNLLYI